MFCCLGKHGQIKIMYSFSTVVGPSYDRRIFNMSLPVYPVIKTDTIKKLFLRIHGLQENKNIGVLVSGGIDSAITYYLLTKLNIENNNIFNITPYTILRKEGSKKYALPIINYVQKKFNLPITDLNVVGDNTLPEIQQVDSGVNDIFNKGADFVYLGIISARDEHRVNWSKFKFAETVRKKYPLLNLEKSHVIDLYIQHNLLDLLEMTYSCAIDEINACNSCNGCNERNWGLKEMGLK